MRALNAAKSQTSVNTAERIACPDCGLVQKLPAIPGRHVVECTRCGRGLIGRVAGRIDLPLALATCALLLMLPAAMAPLMSVSTFGAERENWLATGVEAFASQGFPELGALVLICAVILPFAFLAALVWVLGNLHFAPERASGNPWLGRVYRWVGLMRPWMMLDVFLIGGFVAYTRIGTVARVEVDAGGWCLIGATFAMLFALTQLDDRTVWVALFRLPDEPHRQNGPPWIACTTCDLLVPGIFASKPCPRCHARLHRRKPDSVRRTAALLIAGYLLYIPANLLPVMTLTSVGGIEHNTILGGVFELIHNNLWPLALIVFVASIVLPLMKLFSLTWMVVAIRRRSGVLVRPRTRLYRTIDLIGRWSNIDVFMGSVLVALLQFGALTSIRAEPGLVAFAGVVVITMLATEMFDSRLMWDAASRSAQ